jgi:hypothetical protein
MTSLIFQTVRWIRQGGSYRERRNGKEGDQQSQSSRYDKYTSSDSYRICIKETEAPSTFLIPISFILRSTE